jgi:hypothetical protein
LRKRILCLAVFSPLFKFSPAAWGEEAATPQWMKSVRLTGTVEVDYYRTDRAGITEGGSGSELSIGTLELGAEADLSDFLRGFVLFTAEDIGTGQETGPFVDEATITLHGEGFPLYVTLGKRVQPFGVFENHLVSDPMTQDAYETNRVGATVGLEGPLDSDVSLTLYWGEEQMDHLFESGLFDADTVVRRAGGSDGVESFVLSASVTPLQNHLLYLTVFGAFLSEPGRGGRNETLGLGLSLIPSFLEGLKIDAEYMKALGRERYEGLDGEFREGTFSVAAAYEFVFRRKEDMGGGLSAERKAHVAAEPMEIALRYEHFDDDGLAEEMGTWSVRDRYSAGGRYTFHESDGLTAYLALEYRVSKYRVQPGPAGTPADGQEEVFARLGLAF